MPLCYYTADIAKVNGSLYFFSADHRSDFRNKTISNSEQIFLNS